MRTVNAVVQFRVLLVILTVHRPMLIVLSVTCMRDPSRTSLLILQCQDTDFACSTVLSDHTVCPLTCSVCMSQAPDHLLQPLSCFLYFVTSEGGGAMMMLTSMQVERGHRSETAPRGLNTTGCADIVS